MPDLVMPLCIVCFHRRFHRFQHINQREQHSDLTTELEESRKFALNSVYISRLLTLLLAEICVDQIRLSLRACAHHPFLANW